MTRARRALRVLPVAAVVLFVAAGVAGPWLTGGREGLTDLGRALLAPSLDALLGSDQLGRDQLTRIVAGARGSVVAVAVVTASCLLVGAVVGLTAGWRGGVLDRVTLRLVDVGTAVPTLLVGLVLAAALGGGTWSVALALALTLWPPYVRVVRTETRVRRDDPSNQALLLLGAGPATILVRHVAPALLGPVAVLLGITAAEVIVGVATLSYLGLGAQPPAPEWGSMLVESRPYLSTAPWLFLGPAAAVTAVAVACNVLADRAGTWFTHGVGRVTAPPRSRAMDAPASDALLEIRDLTVRLHHEGADGVTVVDGVDLTVRSGETVAVVGPSGSGKTMTMLAALGLVPQTVSASLHGSVRLAGRELVGLDDRQLRPLRGRVVAYVPQDVGGALNPMRRVGAQVAAVVRRHRGLDRGTAAVRARELLTLVGIDDPATVARQRPDELSGGMRQRVLLAAALAGEPDLLVADEPTSSLDATSAMRITELLADLQRRLGMALVLVTHELPVAARLTSRVAVFDEGRVVETAATDELLRAPNHPVSRRLVAAAEREVEPDPRQLPASTLLRLRDLRVEFPGLGGRPAVTGVDGVDLEVGHGEILGVVGSSGSGKSTLARAIAGIERFATGTVHLEGRPVVPRERRVQLVFQDPSTALDRRQPVAAALGEALRLTGVHARDVPARTVDLLRRVGLTTEHGTRRPWQLSGGERQRAVIARSLVGDPALLVLDEPVSSLDSVHRGEIVDVLVELRAEGLAMLLVSHDLGLVERLADRVVVMHEGRVVDDGHPAAGELRRAREFFQPSHPRGEPRR